MTHHLTFAPLRSTDFGKKPWCPGFRSFQYQFVFYPSFDWPKKGHESLRTPGFGQAKVLSGKFTNLYKLSSVGWCLPLSFWMGGKTSEDSSYDWVYHVGMLMNSTDQQNLSSAMQEQLSKQDHYDFGMRAVKFGSSEGEFAQPVNQGNNIAMFYPMFCFCPLLSGDEWLIGSKAINLMAKWAWLRSFKVLSFRLGRMNYESLNMW